MSTKLTAEQEAILSFCTPVPPRHAIVRARAGTGKTFILTEVAKRLPPPPSFYDIPTYLAFNKSIAEELSAKMPNGINISTFHALGYRAMRNRFNSKTDTKKYHKYIEEQFPALTYEQRSTVVTLLDVYRNRALSPYDVEYRDPADDLPDGLLPEELPPLTSVDYANILAWGVETVALVDFTDMLYLPMMRKEVTFKPPRVLMVDEAQDTNPLQRHFLRKLVGEKTTLLVVGDDRQAIYAFRGASHNSLDLLAEEYDITDIFPLTTTFRCPTSVVELAQKEVPDLRAMPSAPAGYVHTLQGWPTLLPSSSLIVCRNNRPLAKVATRLLRERRHFETLTPFFSQLSRFVQKIAKPHTHIPLFVNRLRIWEDEQLEKSRPQYHEGIKERVETLLDLVAELAETDTVAELLSLLGSIANARGGIKLTTIHKAKGLEAPVVLLLRPNLLPSQYAVTEAELLQERNLWYVAVTRAQTALILWTPDDDPANGFAVTTPGEVVFDRDVPF